MLETNLVWILLCGSMVIFMQAGFAMLETGSTRLKNKGNIVMKNFIDLCVAAPLFIALGFGFMYGQGNGFIGNLDILLKDDYSAFLPDGVSLYSFIFFQLAFCATAATIVSGAMAERTKFMAYCLYTAIISTFIFPIVGHWVWGGGWLSELGFHDFAGSTVVHTVGGVAALVGAWLVGPRIGKYSKTGKAKVITGYSVTFSALGIFILWFGWYGFNGGSILFSKSSIDDLGIVFINTTIATCMATLSGMITSKIRYKKADISLTMNSALAGLVAITASSDCVNVGSAALIGIIAGLVLVLSIGFIEKRLKIDDPVGAISAHGISGIIGTVSVGLFSKDNGIFYTGDIEFLFVQVLGVLAIVVFTFVTTMVALKLIDFVIGLRVEKNIEIEGLDLHEHGLKAVYDDFASDIEEILDIDTDNLFENEDIIVPIEKAIPVTNNMISNSNLIKIEVVCKPTKFEKLKRDLNKIGVTGMTVSKVLGCGVQKGMSEFYRGTAVEVKLLPKIKVEVVVSKVPVELVIETARKALYTGHIGDGKMFIYSIDEVVKIRTGERGTGAMQGIQD